jgi:hypothetical protein
MIEMEIRRMNNITRNNIRIDDLSKTLTLQRETFIRIF